MAKLVWDQVGKRFYETGVDHGVLYIPNAAGAYVTGVSWNGLTAVTEAPSGAEASPQYADNIKYLNLISAEEFGGTIEAFTYPDEFGQCDGTVLPSPGVLLGQQGRKLFGLAYRTQVGNDVDGVDYGYKLHMIWGAQASPSEKAYGTINDSPEAITFSWEITTSPVSVLGYKPTAVMTVESKKVTAPKLLILEDILFGTVGDAPRLPLPDEVITIFTTGVTVVNMGVAANQAVYNATTKIVTLPTVVGVQWQINGVDAVAGAQPALTSGQISEVVALALPNYSLSGSDRWTFSF